MFRLKINEGFNMFYLFLILMSVVSLEASDSNDNSTKMHPDAFSYFKRSQEPIQMDPQAFAYFRGLQEPVLAIPVAVRPPVAPGNNPGFVHIVATRKKRFASQGEGFVVFHTYQPINGSYQDVSKASQQNMFLVKKQ